MDWLTYVFTPDDVFWLETFVGDWFFVIAAGLFVVELLRYAFKKQITKNLLGDSVANFVTLALYIAIVSLVGLAYLGIFFYVGACCCGCIL